MTPAPAGPSSEDQLAYCTIAQLSDRYSERFLLELSDRALTVSDDPAIDAAMFERAIADASAEIDGYLLGRYRLPIDNPPPLLVDLAQRMAIYKAHATMVPEKIRDDYKDALKTLALIANATIRLAGVDGAEADGSGLSGGVQMTEPERPMTVQSMKGYI